MGGGPANSEFTGWPVKRRTLLSTASAAGASGALAGCLGGFDQNYHSSEVSVSPTVARVHGFEEQPTIEKETTTVEKDLGITSVDATITSNIIRYDYKDREPVSDVTGNDPQPPNAGGEQSTPKGTERSGDGDPDGGPERGDTNGAGSTPTDSSSSDDPTDTLTIVSTPDPKIAGVSLNPAAKVPLNELIESRTAAFEQACNCTIGNPGEVTSNTVSNPLERAVKNGDFGSTVFSLASWNSSRRTESEATGRQWPETVRLVGEERSIGYFVSATRTEDGAIEATLICIAKTTTTIDGTSQAVLITYTARKEHDSALPLSVLTTTNSETEGLFTTSEVDTVARRFTPVCNCASGPITTTETPTPTLVASDPSSAWSISADALERAGQLLRDVSSSKDVASAFASVQEEIRSAASDIESLAKAAKQSSGQFSPALALLAGSLNRMADAFDKAETHLGEGSPAVLSDFDTFLTHLQRVTTILANVDTPDPPNRKQIASDTRALAGQLTEAGWSARGVSDQRIHGIFETRQSRLTNAGNERVATAAKNILALENDELREYYQLDDPDRVQALEQIVENPDIVDDFTAISTDTLRSSSGAVMARSISKAGSSLMNIGTGLRTKPIGPYGRPRCGEPDPPCNPCSNLHQCEEGEITDCYATKKFVYTTEGVTPSESSIISWVSSALPGSGPVWKALQDLAGQVTDASIWLTCYYTACDEFCCPYPIPRRECRPETFCEYKWQKWEDESSTGYSLIEGGPYDPTSKLTDDFLKQIKRAKSQCENCNLDEQ